MKKLKVDVIAGARPNFMKVAALFAVAEEFPTLDLRLIFTGQHYDPALADVFFRDLGLPAPACSLGVGSGSHGYQTAEIMKGYEQWVMEKTPDICVVVGDVNSTVACTLVAAKLGIAVAHVEAGLRSFDRGMPEEINRILTDSISDFLFVSEPSGVANLAREGRPNESIFLVGNVMIDTLLRMKPRADEVRFAERLGLKQKDYVFFTLHRPSNVDDSRVLSRIIDEIVWLSGKIPIVFPVHPRTLGRLNEFDLMPRLKQEKNVILLDPVAYLESLSLMQSAKLVVTDSGGLQEETTFLETPCVTLRENTERPVTVDLGTNTLVGHDWRLFKELVEQILAGKSKASVGGVPLWDGETGRRILKTLSTSFAHIANN